MRVAFFVTCVGDTLFPETGIAVVRVLERLGHEVVFPAEQTCCGQMHINSGYRDDALRLARRFVDVMGRDDGVDAVVSPSSATPATPWSSSPARPPRPTSNCSAWRGYTVPVGSWCCWSEPAEPSARAAERRSPSRG